MFDSSFSFDCRDKLILVVEDEYDIGDIIVVLINLMVRNKLTLADCLEKAFLDIAPSKGKMIDGIFVKQKDLDAMAAAEAK